jgi:hypothetical protein
MRKLSTRSLELYYPEQLKPTALRIAARMEDCVDQLRARTVGAPPRKRVLAYLTSANFNNAYVVPDYASLPQQMVLPGHMTLELFHFLNLGATEVGDVGCHEAVHYVQMEQTDGVWGVVNRITGGLFQPNVFTETWFLEGMATYYEGHLPRATGRPHSPVWNGFYAAVVDATGGDLDGNFAYLSPEHEWMDPFGGNYLGGSQFIGWLARTYGEEKLWQLVERQGSSIFSPVGVTLRFKAVYGKSIGALFDEYVQSLSQGTVARRRPATQEVVAREVGYFARLAASAADGATAVVSAEREEPVNLTVRERDGRVRFSRRLTQFFPGRRWILNGPSVMSGLSFTADGRWLYLVAGDVDSLGNYIAKLWRVDARTGDVERLWRLDEGMGGSITPDGKAYVSVRIEGDTANLVRLDLETERREQLTRFEGLVTLGPPTVSPDGARLVFPMRGPDGWDLALREADGTVRWLTRDGRFNYSPRWVDDGRIVFLREHEGRLQAHVLDVSTGKWERITDAPHLVMDAVPMGGDQLAFLNRDGITFSLDRAPLAPVSAPSQSPLPLGEGQGEGRPAETEALAVAEPPSAPGKQLEVLSDEGYSSLEGLFIPELRFPYLYALPGSEGEKPVRLLGGLSVAGQDRLGFHAYALNVGYDSEMPTPSVSLSYGTALLSPWYLRLSGARVEQRTRTDLQVSAFMSRSFWTTPVTLGVFALRRDYRATERRPALRTTFVGPEVSTSYFAGESTSYGGTQRGLGLSASAGVFPRAFAGDRTLGDLRVGLETYLGGLPFTGYDNLQLSAVGRFLPGAPEGLLEVGGIRSGYTLFTSRDAGGADPLPLQYQAGVAFSEYLRGYEDFTISAKQAAIASARYRYRLIINEGWASTLYLGPSFLLKQLEFEGFASWARTDWRSNHRAAGAAVLLRSTFGQSMPVTLYYQFAHRFDDGLGQLHFVGLVY